MSIRMQIQYAGYALQNHGDFMYRYKMVDGDPTPVEISFKNPNCKLGLCIIPIRRGDPIHPAFGWNGNLERPTLTPSIGCDQRCGWHGHITNGEILP